MEAAVKRVVCAVLMVAMASVAAAQERPSVVILLVDDAGYADFGFTGCEDWDTPAIDKIAAEGVVCEAGYVSASVCSPSRAGLLTGMYQQRLGHEFNLASGPGYGLPTHAATIADAMRAEGYATGAFGKWHLGAAPRFQPLERGFDEFYGYLAGSRGYFPLGESAGRQQTAMRGREAEADPDDGYVTDTLAREAAAFIERHAEEPYFVYVAFTAVHTPMHAREEDLAAVAHIEPESRRTLAAMTLALDRAVGQIMAAVESTGKSENTLVFFLNDNGGATNNASDNGVWRGMKGSKFEGGVRVPFVVRWPVGLEPGRLATPVSSLDILPTAVAASGGRAGQHVDGVDLLPVLRGAGETEVEADAGAERRLFWRRGVAAAVREGRWKLVRVKSLDVQLYDLDADPGERDNLAEAEPETVERLMAALQAWEAELAEPLWTEGERWERNQIRKHSPAVRTREQERGAP